MCKNSSNISAYNSLTPLLQRLEDDMLTCHRQMEVLRIVFKNLEGSWLAISLAHEVVRDEIICVFLFIIFSINWSGSQVKGGNASQQEVALPMKDIVAFMALCQRSINERDQASVERKLSNLSLILSRCNMARGRLIDEFARTSNPFNTPEIAATFDTLTENSDDFFRKNNKALNSQWENEQWGQLCTLCQNEVTAANKELSQILKTGESAQITDQTER